MLELVAAMVVLFLVGPFLVIGAYGGLLLVAGLLPSSPRRVRERFDCPVTKGTVTAEFLVPEGAAHPRQVSSCTAFRDPQRVTCQQACCEVADVRWGMPRGVFPRWALTANGPVGWRSAEEPAGPEVPEPAR